MFTSHGHQIAGSTVTSPAPNFIARCSAFIGCTVCLREASEFHRRNVEPAVTLTGMDITAIFSCLRTVHDHYPEGTLERETIAKTMVKFETLNTLNVYTLEPKA